MKGRYRKPFVIAFACTVVVLIVLHTFFAAHVTIDNTTVLLLAVLLLIPFLPWITKIKYGDFEAEIGRAEIKKIEKDLNDTLQQPAPSKTSARKDELETYRELVHTDATVALLKIRIALEERLRALIAAYLPDRSKERLSISPMVHLLRQEKIVDDQLANAIRGVANVANRAVHGESISEENLDNVVDLALRVIRSLDALVFERALGSMRSEQVDQKLVTAKMNATYEITTIMPYTESPERRTYRMNQAELDAWLENYADYAEFIVSVHEVPDKKQLTQK